jgi:LmbE family N-acetylglucosaminyl deacetylase
VLCLGAHCDDIEIGCGGTMLELVRTRPDTEFRWVVLSSDAERAAEARAGVTAFLEGARHTLHVESFRNGYFPWIGAAIKDYFETLKSHPAPDLIFTPWREDRHQDHRLVSDLTWNTFRDHTILEYEIPKYDGDLGRPSVFVPLDADTAGKKARLITTLFGSQSGRSWMSEETFRSLMRLRGIECAAPSGYAEAFHARKLVIG